MRIWLSTEARLARKKKKNREEMNSSGRRELLLDLIGEPIEGTDLSTLPRVCSMDWAELAVGAIDHGQTRLGVHRGRITASVAKILAELERAEIYPPPGMIRCIKCGVHHPPQYLTSRGACYDCLLASLQSWQIHELPPSSSAMAFRAIADGGLKVKSRRLF